MCSPKTEIVLKLGPYESGFQVADFFEYPMPASVQTVAREYLVITASYDNSYSNIPGYRPDGESVRKLSDDGSDDNSSDSPTVPEGNNGKDGEKTFFWFW
jgi:hypothetical protein